MRYTPTYKLCKALHRLHPNINPGCNKNSVERATFCHSQVLQPDLTVKGISSIPLSFHSCYKLQSLFLLSSTCNKRILMLAYCAR